MRIAVDFDGTIVEHMYPRIGNPIPDAIETILKLQQAGHKIILWTYRSGDTLKAAVEYCQRNGIKLYAANQSEPNENFDPTESRLIDADVFIDDRNVGGLLPWKEIEKIILG